MENDALNAILREWSPATASKSIYRNVRLPAKLHPDLVLAIQGVRRCGKSTLLSQLPLHYGLDPQNCYYCNFEDPRLSDVLDHRLLYQILDLVKTDPERPCYFFFDEIQEVKNWEKFLHQQLERPKNHFFTITGSNASLLSGELATALTGRHLKAELYPFNFKEFQALCPGKTLQDYLLSGGFPRALTDNAPQLLLQEYFSNIVNKDVLMRLSARNPKALMHVAKMLFDTCGSELSYRKIAAVTGLSVDTVQSYLHELEQAYLLFTCHFFSFSEKQRVIKNKKYYPIDPALRSAVTSTFNRDLGKSLETLVFLRLKQRYKEVYYFSDQAEVDFVVLDGSAIVPYQVSLESVQPRHEKALEAFYQAYPQAQNPVFINLENADTLL